MMKLIPTLTLEQIITALDELIGIVNSNKPVCLCMLDSQYWEIEEWLYDDLQKISRIKLNIKLSYKDREIESDGMLYMGFCEMSDAYYVKPADMVSIHIAAAFLKSHLSAINLTEETT